MCFPNIDCQKLNAVTISQIEIVETHGPIYIGWSGIAAEYQRHGFCALEVGQSDRILGVGIVQFEVRGDVSRFGRKGFEPLLPGFKLPPIMQTFPHQGTCSCALAPHPFDIHIKPMLRPCQIMFSKCLEKSR